MTIAEFFYKRGANAGFIPLKDVIVVEDSQIFTITFNPTGGSAAPATMRTGVDGRLPSLPIPTRANRTFNGWRTAETGGDRVTTNTVFTADTTIFARWMVVSDDDDTDDWIIQTPNPTPSPEPSPSPEPTPEETPTPTPEQDPAPTPDPTPIPQEPFADVSSADWFYEHVNFVREHGLMAGISENEFAPNQTVTRAMVVQVLYNFMGQPDVASSSDFADVAAGRWYYNAITWAARNDIAAGFGDDTFRPEQAITREQVAVIFNNFIRATQPDLFWTQMHFNFNDSESISPWASEAIQVLANLGVINGYPDGTFRPQGEATRAELAAMLREFVEFIEQCAKPKLQIYTQKKHPFSIRVL